VSRAERERAAYDEEGVFERSHGWHVRFKHVFESPNTRRQERAFHEAATEGIAGRRVLEIGCGDGTHAQELAAAGAGYVLGIDVAETFVARAREKAVPGRLEFAVADAGEPIGGTFDLVYGRAILHHLDYRPVLERLYAQNLSPGGRMVFMEPLGTNLLIRVFHAIAPSAQTRDEKPFDRGDVRWLERTFRGLQILPVNYLSFPLGLFSSFLFAQPDNALLRMADRADVWISRNVPELVPHFRQAIFVIAKDMG
jgi:SAM-dependent methyltransferase